MVRDREWFVSATYIANRNRKMTNITIDWIEFNDSDDPRSTASKKHDSKVRITFTPEAMVVVLPRGGELGVEDQQALGKLLRLAYYQGKDVGAALEGSSE